MRPRASKACLQIVGLFAFSISMAFDAAAADVVFAIRQPKGPHWYENFGHGVVEAGKPVYGAQGRLCKLNLETGRLTLLLNDAEGGVRDPQVNYRGDKILFSYRRGGTAFHHLYEINADGTHLKQLTSDPFDDIEPSYLPDGGIVFCSSRCQRYVPCWYVQVATLHRCDGDGRNIRPLSSNIEQDNTPWVLPDGRVLYTRWEYVDRSREHFHHLWAMNPDGTGQSAFYGNMRPGDVFLDAKPIRNGAIVMINSPNHGRQEHEGRIAVVDPSLGPDVASAQTIITTNSDFRDPHPLSDDSFLAAQRDRLVLVNRRGEVREIYMLTGELARGGAWIHEPRPLRPRPREPVITPRLAPQNGDDATGRILVSDIYEGRNMAGIRRGTIKKLLVLENLPKPVNYGGSMEPISYGGSYTLNRIFGTVPVEPDGSVHASVPALRSLQLVALDEDDVSVKRMLSFITVMPGETTACTGCHEHRASAPAARPQLAALQRPPSVIEPIPGMPEVFDYPRDIQPIWDRHCLKCHGTEDYVKTGRALLTGDQGPIFTHSYFTLSARVQIADGRDLARGNYDPYTIGSSASPLMNKVIPAHYDVKLSPDELRRVKLWIDASATFPGTYAALGSGMIGSYAALQYGTKPKIDYLGRPVFKAAKEVVDRRCAGCHQGSMKLPGSPADDLDLRPHHLAYGKGAPRFWNPPWITTDDYDASIRPGSLEWMQRYADRRLQFSRHILYNLSSPQSSLLLLAPLGTNEGGYGICGEVFASARDPDFQTLLASINEGRRELDSMTRFNMPNFKPEPEYIREMKSYGVLARDWQIGAPLDVYALDRKYWRSLWFPASGEQAAR